jgi:predicted amidohydrolase YtcJ
VTDLLLHSGRLPGHAEPVDITITDGSVAMIAPSEHSAEVSIPHTEVIDLDGRTVLPGLWDHHVHFDQWAQVSRRLDLSATSSAAHLADAVADWITARGAKLDLPIVGYGFRDALWPDAPNRPTIDRVTGDRPTVLVSGDLHSAWLNSAALTRYGHPDHPTGLLREDAAMAVLGSVSALEPQVADRWARDAADRAAQRGVVGIVDLERPFSIDTWTRRVQSGNRALRVAAGVWPESLAEAISRGLRSGDVIDGTFGQVKMGPFKVITDGSLNTRTAYCHDPYPGSAGSDHPYGLLLVAPEQLVPLLVKATAAGLRCAVHAIGDHANSLALQAFAESGATGSIEHAQLLDDTDVPRFAQLGVVASVQPEHALDDRDVADHHWAGRTHRAFALRRLLDSGAILTLGSDAPVAPLDPWIGIAAAVRRTRDDRPAWHPEQRITVGEALTASYRDPQTGRGGIEVGDDADLVICDLDPFTATATQLREMPVAGTLLSGRWTHRSGI